MKPVSYSCSYSYSLLLLLLATKRQARSAVRARGIVSLYLSMRLIIDFLIFLR